LKELAACAAGVELGSSPAAPAILSGHYLNRYGVAASNS
jgi:hypothetical protein